MLQLKAFGWPLPRWAMGTALHKSRTTVAGRDGEAQTGMFLVQESRGVEQHPAETGRRTARSLLRSLTVPTHLLGLLHRLL